MANFFPDSAKACAKILANSYPDFPQEPQGIIGGPAESCCASGADIVQAYAAPYPKWMISKVLGAHRKNRKVSRVLQIAVILLLLVLIPDLF